jgi:tripartite-type tricarboxylate transporter receptor subunit TctC
MQTVSPLADVAFLSHVDPCRESSKTPRSPMASQLERNAMLGRKASLAIVMVAIAVLAAVISCIGGEAQAQIWPQRPVRIIVPYAAGGNSDGMARIAAQRLTEAFGQTFVVENRLGANGAIAAEAVARSAGDGYTLLWGVTPPITINPALTHVNYDPIKDFAPISAVGTNAFVLLVTRISKWHLPAVFDLCR